MRRVKPRREGIEHSGMHGFLPRLRTKEPARAEIARKSGLPTRAALGQTFASRQVPQKQAKGYAPILAERERGKVAARGREPAIRPNAMRCRRYFGGVPFSVQS